MKTALGFVVGFASGWAVRSSVDSGSGVALRTLELFVRTRSRITRWAALEREQIADLVAELQSHYQTANAPSPKSNGAP